MAARIAILSAAVLASLARSCLHRMSAQGRGSAAEKRSERRIEGIARFRQAEEIEQWIAELSHDSYRRSAGGGVAIVSGGDAGT